MRKTPKDTEKKRYVENIANTKPVFTVSDRQTEREIMALKQHIL